MSISVFSSGLWPLQAFLFGGTGGGELALVFVILLLLFGPRKLPEIARMIGKVISQLRTASNDFRDQIMRIEVEPEASEPSVDVESDEVARREEGEESEEPEEKESADD